MPTPKQKQLQTKITNIKNKPNQQYKVTKYGYTKMADLTFDFTAGRCQKEKFVRFCMMSWNNL